MIKQSRLVGIKTGQPFDNRSSFQMVIAIRKTYNLSGFQMVKSFLPSLLEKIALIQLSNGKNHFNAGG